ncbi:gamma-glutamyl hydrolase [Paenibacillus psychroresistens]|uniref:Gamma-glutamyl hydrolase n=1 Tax=Paenibacillus psychroresistens TaxID=1778678 RepID=A0A6B8RBV8_9BACL|nr:C40 family peptidase [Paenibacillus psychroresistens]QGQ93720.1 gamma-glutamyl hydrolase [Paenibacillus psychroresistens]
MFKHTFKRTICITAAAAILFSGGAFSHNVYAAKDDMDAVSLAKLMLNKDYAAYEESPSSGFDASGLMYYVYKTLNYNIPRELTAQYQMKATQVSAIANLKAGDLVFFGSKGKPTFDGIYMDNGKFVMASKGKDEVVSRKVAEYKDQFLGAKRILSKADQLRVNLILDGEKYLGRPYDFGAAYGQTKTFDCSTFTKTVFNENGIFLPRVSRDQATTGKYVSKSNLIVGDLVFFTTTHSKGRIGHVGIYVGDGQMIHTYGEGGVRYVSINKDWWKDHYVTARRVI